MTPTTALERHATAQERLVGAAFRIGAQLATGDNPPTCYFQGAGNNVLRLSFARVDRGGCPHLIGVIGAGG